MLAMTLLLADFIAIPVLTAALVALLVSYRRRLTAAEAGGAGAPTRKEA